jgi:CheY-like chemotaxis protein
MTLQPNVFPNDQPRPRTILLIEDEPFVREATCGILQSAGFRVLQAADASDALNIYIYEERTSKN